MFNDSQLCPCSFVSPSRLPASPSSATTPPSPPSPLSLSPSLHLPHLPHLPHLSLSLSRSLSLFIDTLCNPQPLCFEETYHWIWADGQLGHVGRSVGWCCYQKEPATKAGEEEGVETKSELLACVETTKYS